MSNLLQTLHNSTEDNEETENEMGDFNPPAAPESSGVERTTDVKESPVSKYLREGSENQTGSYVNQATEYQDERLEMDNYLDNYGSKAMKIITNNLFLIIHVAHHCCDSINKPTMIHIKQYRHLKTR